MSENIIPISQHHRYCRGSRRGRQRLFDLGEHRYSGSPGHNWVTNYWIKKVKKGTLWELFCSQEESLRRKESCGNYTADQLRDYFEEVGFELEEDHWREIGLGRTATKLKYSRGPRKLRMWW